MPPRILDTNILLTYVRRSALYLWLEAHFALATANPTPIISVASEGELRSLALQLSWGEARLKRTQEPLDLLPIIPLPFRGVTEACARIDDYSRRRGVTMGKNDIWITATAHVTGVRLLTTDRDFDHLHDVFVERDWVDPLAAS